MNGSNKIPLSLNLMLAAVLAALIWHYARPAVAVPVATKPVPAKAKPAAEPIPKLGSYSDLKSGGDWRQWLDQLRAQGVPTPVLARLVQAGFENRWQKRLAEAKAAFVKNEIDTSGLAAMGIQHDRDEENEMRAALGDAEFRRYDMGIVLRSLPLRNVTLTLSESESLYDMEKKLQHQAQDLIEMQLKGEINPTEYESRIQKAQAERDEQLKALIGEQRYAAMYPPPNEAAEKLTKDLRDIALPANVSFDALVDLQNQWNERRGEAQQRLQEAKTSIANCEDELRKINSAWEMENDRMLSTNSYDAAIKESDPRYTEMKNHAGDWSLDNSAMDYVFRTIQYYEKATADYQRQTQALEANGETVDWDAVNKNLQQFADQTGQALRSYLGDERFNKIKRNQIFPFAPEPSPSPAAPQ